MSRYFLGVYFFKNVVNPCQHGLIFDGFSPTTICRHSEPFYWTRTSTRCNRTVDVGFDEKYFCPLNSETTHWCRQPRLHNVTLTVLMQRHSLRQTFGVQLSLGVRRYQNVVLRSPKSECWEMLDESCVLCETG